MEKVHSLFAKWRLIAVSDRCHVPEGRWSHGYISQLHNSMIENKFSADDMLKVADYFYQGDLLDYLGQTNAQKELQLDIKRLKDVSNRKFWFLTLGLDDKVITVPRIKETILRLKDIKGIEVGEYVIEKHRRDEKTGKIYIHHHIHAIVYTDFAKEKTVQFIFQKMSGKKF